MHAAQISFYLDPLRRPPLQLLEDWPSLGDVAEAAATAGARISVIQACARTETVTSRGVDYHFLAPDPGSATVSQSRGFAELLRKLSPDVLHVHGFGFPRDVQVLARLAPGVPILLQDHANGLPRFWQRPAWRRGFSCVSGLAITGTAKLEPFRAAGLLRAQPALFDIPESSSRFVPGDRTDARRATGLHGDPGLLWVGHLNRNKDPLTVLDGVSRAAARMPGLQLWCCFGSAPQLRDVRRRIEADPLLTPRVQLLGAVPHSRIETLMRAADVFVSGSHAEGSGYAVLEALACGLPVAVTDIPAFRSLLGTGERVGRFWACGNARLLSEALVSLGPAARPAARGAVRAHFERELSFAAIGRKLLAAYEQLLSHRSVLAEDRSTTNRSAG